MKNRSTIAAEAILKWENIISKDLNIPKITIFLGEEHPINKDLLGEFQASLLQDMFDIFGTKATLVPEESHIDLYLNMILKSSGRDLYPIRMHYSKKAIEREVVRILAHEMRHVYQFMFKKRPAFEFSFGGGLSSTEYDAYNYADEFIKKHLKG